MVVPRAAAAYGRQLKITYYINTLYQAAHLKRLVLAATLLALLSQPKVSNNNNLNFSNRSRLKPNCARDQHRQKAIRIRLHLNFAVNVDIRVPAKFKVTKIFYSTSY